LKIGGDRGSDFQLNACGGMGKTEVMGVESLAFEEEVIVCETTSDCFFSAPGS